VELAWVIFGICLILIPVVMFLLKNRRAEPICVKKFNTDEHGASYTITFILSLPFIMGLIALMMETTFILVAKFGTLHAAYMAGRSAIVWTTSDHNDYPVNGAEGYFRKFPSTQEKAEIAAVRAMVPFAGGFYNKSNTNSRQADQYVKVYREFISDSAEQLQSKQLDKRGKSIQMSDNFIRNKLAYAQQATKVKLTGKSENGNEPWQLDVVAEVSYEFPYAVARIPWFRERVECTIKSKAAFQNESPKNKNAKLGIDFMKQ
jgi:Flp pilus assembly protein TadG